MTADHVGGAPLNRHGGLTLVPMPGFEELANRVGPLIEVKPIQTPTNIVVPEFGFRANGEPYVRLGKEKIGDYDCIVLTSGPGTYEMIGQLSFLLGYLVGRQAARITVITGYFPLSRSDKDEGDMELALTPHVTHMLRSSAYGKLDRITSVDMHSSQGVGSAGGMGIINQVHLGRRVLTRAVEDAKAEGRSVVVHLTDDGAVKNFRNIIGAVEEKQGVPLPMTYGSKIRVNSHRSEQGRIHGNVEALPGSTVISLDDEGATMGTLIGAAEKILQEHQVNEFWAAMIHGVLCEKGPGRLLAPDCPISRSYTSDTIPLHNRPELEELLASNLLRVVPWHEDLAHIIYHRHWGKSIREVR